MTDNTPQNILVVDDEAIILETVRAILEDEGFVVNTVGDGESALEFIDSGETLPDLVLLDIWLPGMDGLEVLEKIKDQWPQIPVVIMSGHGNVETAVRATRLGAYDFIEKPLSLEPLIVTINNALKFQALENENIILKATKPKDKARKLIGDSPAMQELRKQIEIVAPTEAWILITGENGTGKELVAQTVHYASARRDKPLIDVNCAAIPEELIESELFGHEKGAFTGASSMKRGKFDLANGGTLFLDEIGDMSLKTQAKILRILQEQRFSRVGGSKTIKVNVRIIAATNKDLEEAIKKGEFREDLYFRLNVIPIEVPPLREHLEDIPLLVEEFIEEFRRDNIKAPVRSVSPEVIEALKQYDWPGNVRELRNIIERMFILSGKPEITSEDLPAAFRNGAQFTTKNNGIKQTDSAALRADNELDPCFTCNDFREARKLFEKKYLTLKLEEFDGNIKKTAEAIGIERRHLHRKIKSLEITV